MSVLWAASDDELVGLVAERDHDAFSVLYDRMSPRVLGMTRKVLVDVAQSEEVAQEVFLELWQNAASFDPGRGRAGAWMLTLAHRRAVDRVRAAQASKNRDWAVGVRSFHPDFDSTYESAEIAMEHLRVQDALGRISAHQRQAVELNYRGEHTLREISVLLDVPLGTMKTRLRDGLIRLRQELNVA